MRRFLTCTAALLVALTSTVLLAQKVGTPEDLDKAMKRIAPAQASAGKAIQSGAWADAKSQLATVKQALADTEPFWASHKKNDAVKMLKDSIARVNAVEEAVSAPMPNQQAALAAFRQVGATCVACHMQYREQDENQQYRLKTGSI